MIFDVDTLWAGKVPNFCNVISFIESEDQPTFAKEFHSRILSDIEGLPYEVSCFVHVDEDIRTSQYVDSCGSAALSVALRHLHPGRLGQAGQTVDKTQPLADFDFEFELRRPNHPNLSFSDIGRELGKPVYRGRPGFILWNQLTFYGLTNNQIGAFMELFNRNNKTGFRLYYHSTNISEGLKFKQSRIEKVYKPDRFFVPFSNDSISLENQLLNILFNNRLAIVLTDGLVWTDRHHYDFPADEKEWNLRGNNPHTRPSDCLVIEEHPVLAEISDLIRAYGCQDEENSNNRDIDWELCKTLKRSYEHLKDVLKPTMIGHAVVVSGVYVHAETGLLLWRVLDSNGSSQTRLNFKSTAQDSRINQGSVNYMTTSELHSRMKGEGDKRSLRMLEVVPSQGGADRVGYSPRNLIVPVVYSNFNS